ncbi:solute carrier family 35 member E3-like isoform X1 [Dermacentor albipictus]|uniref:solute carrier family 35 member E3-like isoform X1 n=2 Tax=Dermacentor albipictus TaxID=60249 RepID=UPI0038FC7ADB
MIAPSHKAPEPRDAQALLRARFYWDQVKRHSMRRHHRELSRRQREGPRRPPAEGAHQTTPSLTSESTSAAALAADALEPQGDFERRHCDGVDNCVMGLSAEEPSLPLLGPVGKATSASSSLLTATPTASSRPTSVADPALPARRRPERRHRWWRRWWRHLSPLSRCASRGESLGVPLVSALNLSLAVSVVVSCKLCYDRARLPNLSLTVVHLAASLAALRTAAAFKVTWAPQTPTSENAGGARVSSSASATASSSLEHWRLAVLLCAFMALPNLSLEFNTAGTSTLLRLLSLPVTAWLQTTVFGRRQRRAVVLSLLPVALGVSMNALGDLRFNPVGLFFGVAGAAAAAFYFTLAAEQQRRLCQPPWQLLESQLRRALPALALVALLLEPPWRGPRGLLARQWAPRDAALLVGSSLAGCLLTLTMQWLLGRTSALTYQVLGHVKMCATLLACAVVFDEHLKPVQQGGVFLTLCGAVLYTVFKARDDPASSTAPPRPDRHRHPCNQPLLGPPPAAVK